MTCMHPILLNSFIISCLSVVRVLEWSLRIRMGDDVVLRVERRVDWSRRWVLSSSLLGKLVAMKLWKSSCGSGIVKPLVRPKLVSKLLLLSDSSLPLVVMHRRLCLCNFVLVCLQWTYRVLWHFIQSNGVVELFFFFLVSRHMLIATMLV